MHVMRMTLLLAAVALSALPAAAQSPLDQLGWMGGCWQSGSGSRETIEMWMPPAGGLMLGASRTVVSGRAREFEHLRLRADGDTLVYTALPSGQAETHFRSTGVSADGFTVENLEHDFPQRIIYRRTGPNAMTARVEGPGPNGPRGFDFAFRRAACEKTGESG
jgi:hypothetical protein